ncbi:Fucose 4-O-acetylase [Lachnospiraceae bacterium]|nr:Fucose 4-O-acetylase [Lachnospiraceae bacterium]
MKERNIVFDNIKGLMLFFVAFGHVLDVYCSNNKNIIEYDIMKYIYLFHMPMFAFITGFFSKNVEKSRDNAVKKILIPYILFQSVYVLMASIMIKLKLATFNANVFNYSIILPSSAFYYLLATFFWKIFAKDIIKLKKPIIVSVLLGLIISLTRFDDFHTGYGAVFSLLPFFVLGLAASEELINKIRGFNKLFLIIILIAGIIPAHFFPYAIHSIRLTYAHQGFGNIEGMLWRIVYYVIAIVMGMAIVGLVPNKGLFFSRVGKNSILVYAISTFLSPSLYVLIDHYLKFSNNSIVNFIIMIIFCVFIIWIASIEIIQKIYGFIIDNITSFIFRKD